MMTMADLQNEIAEQTINRCDELAWFLTKPQGSELRASDTPRMMRELARFLETAANRYEATLEVSAARRRRPG